MFSKKESLNYKEIHKLFSDKSIFAKYIDEFDSLTNFYGQDYRNQQAILDFANQLNYTPEQRKKIYTILKDYHSNIELTSKGQNHLEAILNDNTYTVITGQQCGLFTGPLFTIYKALTTIILAEELTAQSDKKFIPIFWIASEDHDFQEVNHITYADDHGDFTQLSIDLETDLHSVSDIPLGENTKEIIEKISEHWQKTEFSPNIFDLLNEKSQNLAESFLHLMHEIFKDYGLLFIEPKALREASIDFNLQAFENDKAIHSELNRVSEELKAKSFAPALELSEGLNLFYYTPENKRIKLHHENQLLQCKNGIVKKTDEDIRSEIQNHPERFSQNVVLRPINQDRLFPNVATVCGPGEIAYFAQLKGIYEIFNQSMPVIYPRASLTLFQKKFQKIQKRFDLSIVDILNQELEEKTEKIYQNLEDEQFITHFEENLIEEIALVRKRAEEKGKAILDTLNPSIKKIEHEIHKMKGKYIKKVEETMGISKKQVERLKSMMTPKNKPQERVFNYFYYENYYGRELIHELKKQIDINDFKHQVLFYE